LRELEAKSNEYIVPVLIETYKALEIEDRITHHKAELKALEETKEHFGGTSVTIYGFNNSAEYEWGAFSDSLLKDANAKFDPDASRISRLAVLAAQMKSRHVINTIVFIKPAALVAALALVRFL
jgi:hypothetical protein